MTNRRNILDNSTSKEEFGSELGDYNATKAFELLAESKSNNKAKKEPKTKRDSKKKNV